MKKGVITIVTSMAMVATMGLTTSASFAANTNAAFKNSLPKAKFQVTPPMQTALVEGWNDKTGNKRYDIYIGDDFTSSPAATRKAIKAKTLELCKGKKNQYEKARAICTYLCSTMKYSFGYDADLKSAWKYKTGNCMTYAMLTSYMLYYAGIPNGYAHTYGHIFNVAQCDGKWIFIDSQGSFDRPATEYDQIEQIFVCTNRMAFVIDSTKGIKLAQFGYSYDKADSVIKKRGVTIPAWVKGYITEDMFYGYKNLKIRGTKGTAGEKFVKRFGFRKVSYSGKKFTAIKNARTGISVPSVQIKRAGNTLKVKYNKVKRATGFEVGYKNKKMRDYKYKTFKCKKTATKKIRGLVKGKYTVKVRAFKKTGKTFRYGGWTKARKI